MFQYLIFLQELIYRNLYQLNAFLVLGNYMQKKKSNLQYYIDVSEEITTLNRKWTRRHKISIVAYAEIILSVSINDYTKAFLMK